MLNNQTSLFNAKYLNDILPEKTHLIPRIITLYLLCFSIVMISCIACGSSDTVRKKRISKKVRTQASFNPLGDLLAQAQSALKKLEDPNPKAQSRVSFALLHKQAFPSDEASQLALSQAHFSLTTAQLKAAGINSLVSSKIAERFQVLTLPTQTELPIDLKVLKPSLERLKANLSDYQGISIISYQGQALKRGLQITLNCSITEALSQHKLFKNNQDSLLIASLASFEVFDRVDFAQKCQTANYPWLKPVAELLNSKELRLITRGLNQWGRPELELGPIEKSKIAEVFPKFVAITESLRTTTLAKTLDAFKTLQFSECLRPENHYDLSCQRVILEANTQ